MAEPGITRTTALANEQMLGRAKSLKDIDNQYSRISNRLYRQYLDYEIDEDTYKRRMQSINDAYDRYQTNILQTRIPNWQRGMAYPRSFPEYRKPMPRGIYAQKK